MMYASVSCAEESYILQGRPQAPPTMQNASQKSSGGSSDKIKDVRGDKVDSQEYN